MKKLLSILCASTLLLTSTVFAQDSGNGPSVFVTHELNGDSKISSVGVAFNFKQHDSGFGGAVLMSLGRADIVTTKLNVEDYLVWELGGRIGYFSDISIYAEAGVDLGELFGRGHLDEDRYHDHEFFDGDDYHDHYHDHDDYYDHDHRFANDSLDAYVGIGGGIKLGQVQVNGQVRYRQIDSEDWKALDDVYSGVTVSFSF